MKRTDMLVFSGVAALFGSVIAFIVYTLYLLLIHFIYNTLPYLDPAIGVLLVITGLSGAVMISLGCIIDEL